MFAAPFQNCMWKQWSPKNSRKIKGFQLMQKTRKFCAGSPLHKYVAFVKHDCDQTRKDTIGWLLPGKAILTPDIHGDRKSEQNHQCPRFALFHGSRLSPSRFSASQDHDECEGQKASMLLRAWGAWSTSLLASHDMAAWSAAVLLSMSGVFSRGFLFLSALWVTVSWDHLEIGTIQRSANRQ